MARRVFISFAADHERRFEGFEIATIAKTAALTFTGRHELSEEPDTSREKLLEHLAASTVTVVMIDRSSEGSRVIAQDVEFCLEHGIGLLGVKLDADAQTPGALHEAG